VRVLYERCAAVDAGKDVIAVAVRLPGDGPDGRQTIKRTFKTFYGVLDEAMMEPFHAARDLMATIPGTGPLPAAAVISEIGADVREFFPGAAHLASWAGLCPGNHESAGKRYSGRRRHGNEHLQSLLTECAWSAVRHDGYLKFLYHRHVMKRGGYRSKIAKKKAIIVVAHALLVIIWHVLAAGKPYDELGADYFDRPIDPERETRRLVAKLEALGHRVSLEAAA
jgi:transposase